MNLDKQIEEKKAELRRCRRKQRRCLEEALADRRASDGLFRLKYCNQLEILTLREESCRRDLRELKEDAGELRPSQSSRKGKPTKGEVAEAWKILNDCVREEHGVRIKETTRRRLVKLLIRDLTDDLTYPPGFWNETSNYYRLDALSRSGFNLLKRRAEEALMEVKGD